MSGSLLGRVVGEKIELDEPIAGLDGKRVRVTVEVVHGEADEHPVARAIREAPPDDKPITPDERASIEAAKGDPRRYTAAEIRARLSAARNGEPKGG